MGLMQAMLTQSHNDSSPEMLAAVRRGPCSPPTNEEMIEYLLTRKRRDQDRPAFEHFSAEHVLSYQRRIQATKKHFMIRGKRTPLGRLVVALAEFCVLAFYRVLLVLRCRIILATFRSVFGLRSIGGTVRRLR